MSDREITLSTEYRVFYRGRALLRRLESPASCVEMFPFLSRLFAPRKLRAILFNRVVVATFD